MSNPTSTNNSSTPESSNMAQTMQITNSNTLPQHCHSMQDMSSQYYLCSVAVRTAASQYNVNFLVTAQLSNECHNENGTGYEQIISKCTKNWYKAYGTKNYGCYCTVDVNSEGHEILFKKASPISEDLALQMMEIGTERRFEGDNEDSCMKTFELNDDEDNFVECC